MANNNWSYGKNILNYNSISSISDIWTYGTSRRFTSFSDITYTVTYNGNGNTGGTVPTDANNYSTSSGATVLGNTGSLIKTGYNFGGWNTLANGTGTTYAVGSTYTIGTSDVILYAKWNKKRFVLIELND